MNDSNKILINIVNQEDRITESLPENYMEQEISPTSKLILSQLIDENPALQDILDKNNEFEGFISDLGHWIQAYLKEYPAAKGYCKGELKGRNAFEALSWKDIAAIRLNDYIKNEGRLFVDRNLRGAELICQPLRLLWLAYKFDKGAATDHFFIDTLYMFRQFNGTLEQEYPSADKVLSWMDRHPSGLDQEIIAIRENNKKRIIDVFIKKIDEGEINDKRFYFTNENTYHEKYETMLSWWNNRLFHLRFAIRKPGLLNEMLAYTLSKETMDLLDDAKNAGIPTFVNPYYLSLVNVHEPDFARNADLAIRQYVIYSRQLINEYGHIVAWEKEDIVEPGKPNAAGWLLPGHYNIHRRYPEVAILIPDTVGRACGGLCASCQRMFDFQRGNLNFNLDKLKPNETWSEKLKRLMVYFEEDSQLRDILITGGDALMSTDKSLRAILNEVYRVAVNKIEANKKRKAGEKYAEMLRVRLGTRLPVYLPQRITPELIGVLSEFREKAVKIGIRQFVIQTHFETAMEVTPESKEAVKRLLSAGWIITNQQVFTSAGSRRGHTAKLRKVLNEIGVLPYYTFSVKGFMENSNNFATNERAMQEQIEEKIMGRIQPEYYDTIRAFPQHPDKLIQNIKKLEKDAGIPFLATDRNVLNLPGVGKSLTYRTIGLTHDGRRILEFNHDHTRMHSPIIEKLGKMVIIESKSISAYLRQLNQMNEDIAEYETVFGYSIGESEERMPMYIYPDYDFEITDKMTNLEI